MAEVILISKRCVQRRGALAVPRLMTSSNLVARSNGMSAGLAPLRKRPARFGPVGARRRLVRLIEEKAAEKVKQLQEETQSPQRTSSSIA